MAMSRAAASCWVLMEPISVCTCAAYCARNCSSAICVISSDKSSSLMAEIYSCISASLRPVCWLRPCLSASSISARDMENTDWDTASSTCSFAGMLMICR